MKKIVFGLFLVACSSNDLSLNGDYWFCDNKFGYLELTLGNDFLLVYNGSLLNSLEFEVNDSMFIFGFDLSDTITVKSYYYNIIDKSSVILYNSSDTLVLNRINSNKITLRNVNEEQMDKLSYEFWQRSIKHSCSDLFEPEIIQMDTLY